MKRVRENSGFQVRRGLTRLNWTIAQPNRDSSHRESGDSSVEQIVILLEKYVDALRYLGMQHVETKPHPVATAYLLTGEWQ